MDRRVVITGIGAVTPLGTSAPDTWAGLLAGESGAGRIRRFDPGTAGLRTEIACEIPGNPSTPNTVDERSVGRAAEYGMAAAAEALTDAGYDPSGPDWNATRVGTSVACSLAGLPEAETAATADGRPPSRFLLTYLPNMVAGHLSIAVDARGPTRAQAAACAAGTHSLVDAVRDIQHGRADVMLAGGAESPLTPLGVGGFEAMRALSTRTDVPEAASRPFDADRDGFVLGEGAGILVLEAESRARERGATKYATLSGGAMTADAHHPTKPAVDGAGLRRCVERALESANLSPSAVDHVNAHATSTPVGDAAEASALNDILDGAPPTTSVKSQLGHALGAAGAIEAVVAAQTVAKRTLPPTINYDRPDPDCQLPVVTTPTETAVEAVVSTSAGFGGLNGALVFEEP